MSTDWMERAACLKVDPEVMFPHDNDRAGVNLAKAVCAGCQVQPECLARAYALGATHGVWGSLSPRGRKKLRREEAKGAAA